MQGAGNTKSKNLQENMVMHTNVIVVLLYTLLWSTWTLGNPQKGGLSETGPVSTQATASNSSQSSR
jgi:hypothetical protein